MNLTGNSIYRPEEHGGCGISMARLNGETKPQWPKIAYGLFARVPRDRWYWPLVVAWDRLDETAPETPRA